MAEIVQQLAERRGLLDESQQLEVCTATPVLSIADEDQLLNPVSQPAEAGFVNRS